MKAKEAQVHFSKEAAMPHIEVVLARGTKPEELLHMNTVLTDIIGKISPKGCHPCLSGVHLTIREELENVLSVELEGGRVQNLAAH